MNAPRPLFERRKEPKIPQAIKGQLLKVTTVIYRLAINFPDSYPIFGKTPANCGDKVENRPLFRKQSKRAPEKFEGKVSVTRQ